MEGDKDMKGIKNRKKGLKDEDTKENCTSIIK
jgi:hypothetical protein